MMVNEITAGISVKLNSIFGDDFTIYTSNVKQGLKEPCFFIKLLTTFNTPLLGKRKKRAYNFDIHFFPTDDTDNENMYKVGEQLVEEMEYITLLNGDMVRGRDISYEIIDGVLHFKITYTVILCGLIQEEKMDDYGLDVGVRG